MRWLSLWGVWFLAWVTGVAAEPFSFPTANRFLLEPGGEPKFFVGTVGKPWTSGEFGCVRSGGAQFHEGLDIRCLQRDAKGEPVDPVLASAAGTVAYLNARPSLSNYGNYLVLRHSIEGMEVYTLYAHLSSLRKGLKVGDRVAAGEQVATLGRTANTQQGISKDRAHLHFEINLVVNDRYAAWHNVRLKGIRNDHGNFNGRNLLGLDPEAIFREQARLGTQFRLVNYLRSQPVLATVTVRGAKLLWARRYPQLVEANPLADREGVAGYELQLAFNGLPVRVIPRSARELSGAGKTRLLAVNAAEYARRPCGKLVFKRGQVWTLLPRAEDLLDLLTY